MVNSSGDSGSQTVIGQLVVPPGVQDRPALDAWIATALPGAADLDPSVAVTRFELAGEQLLPHRAAKFAGRYTVLFEAADIDGLKPLSDGVASGADTDGAGFAVFRQILDTRTPTTLPEGAVAPEAEIPPGPPGVFLAWTRPVSAEAEDDYNRWYDDFHCPETLHMEGFVRGRRGRRLADVTAGVGIPDIDVPYLTLYEIVNTGAVPFARDVLVPWLSEVGVDHLGPDSYDRTFTQAFVLAELDR